MEWMGWLLAVIAIGAAVWFHLQLRNERATSRRLDDELVDAHGEIDALKDSHARLVPTSEAAVLGRLAADIAAGVHAPLATLGADIAGVTAQLDEYRGLVKAYDNAVQYCLQPVEMIFGADKAGLDQLVHHVEDARRKLFMARAALDKSGLLGDARRRLEAAGATLAGSADITAALARAARAQAGDAESADPGAALDAALAVAASGWNGRIEIVRDYAALPRVKAPADQLTRAFVHLAINAGEAIDGTGRLLVQARPGGSRSVEISFIDDGRGIDEDALPNIFEPFFTTRPAATGLGLASVRNLVKAQGGSINVRSTPGKGSTFIVTLPVEAAPAVTAAS